MFFFLIAIHRAAPCNSQTEHVLSNIVLRDTSQPSGRVL
jgi:hypothetical protein